MPIGTGLPWMKKTKMLFITFGFKGSLQKYRTDCSDAILNPLFAMSNPLVPA